MLVFATDVFADDVEITGPVTVALWASSSAVSTDFVAELIEVFPGRQYRRRFAKGSCARAPVTERRSRARRVATTSTWPPPASSSRLGTACVSTSHRASTRRYESNPNTGGRITHAAATVTATQHVFHDALHPSHITLPIIPR